MIGLIINGQMGFAEKKLIELIVRKGNTLNDSRLPD